MTPSAHSGGSAVRAPGAVTWAPLRGLRYSTAPRFVAPWRSMRFIWLATALVGCEDFPGDPERSVSIEQPSAAQWPSELSVKDTTVLAVDVQDENGTPVTGLGVQWQSDHPDVVEVRSLVPTGANGDQALLAQLRVQVIAQHRGEATITAEVSQPGFEPTVLSRTIRVMEHWTSISAGFTHTCAITIDHDAFCWGSGLIGNGSAAGSPVPVQVGRDLKFKAVTTGDGHSCGLLQDGTVVCWGSNREGAIGNGAAGDQGVPALVSIVSILASVVAGDNYVCGTSTDMAGFCWGSNTSWQLGDAFLVPFSLTTGAPTPPFDDCGILFRSRCSRTPRQVRDRGSFEVPDGVPLVLSRVAPGVTHTCALTDGGTAFCWGSGSAELGSSAQLTTDSTSAVSFVRVPGDQTFNEIASGARHSCAIAQVGGAAYCWGFNSHGQLGIDAPDSTCLFDSPAKVGCSPRPQAVAGGLVFRVLDAGRNSSCGITADSNVYCWGSNESGQLGEPTASGNCDAGTACSSSPVKVDLGGESVVSLSDGPTHACAVTAQGAAFCWGDAAGGKLGSRDAADRGIVVPTRVDEPQ
jgi:alpha-tubulin suppressor-like RCC1 family protein